MKRTKTDKPRKKLDVQPRTLKRLATDDLKAVNGAGNSGRQCALSQRGAI